MTFSNVESVPTSCSINKRYAIKKELGSVHKKKNM